MNGNKETTIYVRVNTRQINDNNLKNSVKFSDDRTNTQPWEGEPKDFISEVSKGGQVIWEGLAQDNSTGDTVEITEIISKDTPAKGKILAGTEDVPGRRDKKLGRIKNETSNEEEPYSVKFRINGGTGKEYVIDPKLRMVE